MLVAQCDCGREVEFIAESGAKSPMKERCKCGQRWRLSVDKIQ